MDNTNTIATVFILIAVQIAQGKPSDPQLCVQATVCGHDGKIYPTPCDAPSFPPPCYDYKRITKRSCICEDRKDLTHVRKGLSLAAEPICKSCGSIVEGQRCGQDGGPYRLNCTQCCQSSSSKCAEWRCDAGGWLCQKSCSTGPSSAASCYSAINVSNNLDHDIGGIVEQSTAFCKNFEYKNIKPGDPFRHGRGCGCLIKKIRAHYFDPTSGQQKDCTDYTSSGTSYGKFEVNYIGSSKSACWICSKGHSC